MEKLTISEYNCSETIQLLSEIFFNIMENKRNITKVYVIYTQYISPELKKFSKNIHHCKKKIAFIAKSKYIELYTI